jgi:hypothetical protein
VKHTSIDEEGNLVVGTAFGKWVHRKPKAYQLIDGKNKVVDAAFEKQKNQKNTYGFKLDHYNRNYELIIDPLVGTMNDGFVTKLIVEPTPPITVISPNGTEDWMEGTTHDITWDRNGQWNVPNVNKDKTQCLMKIMTIDGTVVDTSDNYFTISKF